MSDSKQEQLTSDQLLAENLRTNVEIVCKGDIDSRLASLNYLIDELKKSTSSMTSVPKPMKHLMPYFDDLVKAYSTFSNEEYLKKMADLLSLLSVVSIE